MFISSGLCFRINNHSNLGHIKSQFVGACALKEEKTNEEDFVAVGKKRNAVNKWFLNTLAPGPTFGIHQK